MVAAYFNLSDRAVPIPQDSRSDRRRTVFSSEAPKYSGTRAEWSRIADLMPFECVVVGPTNLKVFI